MSGWNAMSYDARDTILRVVNQEAERFFSLADSDEVWQAPTGAGHWQVRDIVGHLVDTTEAYFVAFDAARGRGEVVAAFGLPGMAARVDSQAQAFRSVPREELMHRARADYAQMRKIHEELTADEWANLLVSHFYMGPLPAFFYPAFQLMDYGVHSWDIREGTGRAHGLDGEAADLLVPFMFVLWKYTTAPTDRERFDVGIRITSGQNAGETRVHVDGSGMNYEPGEVDDLDTVLEFDPGSFVLTAFGRGNAGTIRGDRTNADRYLNLFFRI